MEASSLSLSDESGSSSVLSDESGSSTVDETNIDDYEDEDESDTQSDAKTFYLLCCEVIKISSETIYLIWCSIVVSYSIYLLFAIPFRIAFFKEEVLWSILEGCADVVLFFDFLISLFYFSHRGYKLKSKCCCISFITNFVLDIFLFFPFWAFVFPINAIILSVNPNYSMFLTTPWLKLNQVILILFKLQTFAEVVERILEVNSRRFNYRYVRLWKYTLILCLISHYLAFTYFLINRVEDDGKNPFAFSNDILEPRNVIYQYSISLYWTLITMTGLGISNPTKDIQVIFSMFVILIGIVNFLTLLSMCWNLTSNIDPKERKFKQNASSIDLYMKHLKIDRRTQKRIRSYQSCVWKKSLGMNEQEIIERLPKYFRIRICEHLHLPMLKKVPFFKEVSDSFLRSLMLRLKPSVYPPKSYIIRQGEWGREMFFLVDGSVELFVSGIPGPICRLKEVTFFGELALVMPAVRNASMRTRGPCVLYVLEKRDFEEVCRYYHSEREKVCRVHEERLERFQRVREEGDRENNDNESEEDEGEEDEFLERRRREDVVMEEGGEEEEDNNNSVRRRLFVDLDHEQHHYDHPQEDKRSDSSNSTSSSSLTPRNYHQEEVLDIRRDEEDENNEELVEEEVEEDDDGEDEEEGEEEVILSAPPDDLEPKHSDAIGGDKDSEDSVKVIKIGKYLRCITKQISLGILSCWNVFIILTTIWTCFIIPLRAFFFIDSLWWIFNDIPIIIIYVIDLLINPFHSCYRSCCDRNRNELVHKDSFLKFQAYVGRTLRCIFAPQTLFWTLVDFLSIMPFWSIGLEYWRDYYSFFLLPLCLLKLGKLGTLIHFLEIRTNYYDRQYLRLLKLALFVFISFHFMACGYYFIVHLEGDYASEKFVVGGLDPEKMTIFQKYIRSMFWVSARFAGYSNTQPGTVYESVYSLFVTVFVLVLIFTSFRMIRDMLWRFETEFYDRLDEIKAFMNFRGIPRSLKKDIIKYHKYLKKSGRYIEDSVNFKELPFELRMSISKSYVHHLKQLDFFASCGDEMFLELVGLFLRRMVALPNTYVIQKGEIGDEMFVLVKGSVSILIEDGGVVVNRLRSGSVFGEAALFDKTNLRTAYVRTDTYCEFLVLRRKYFLRVLKRLEFGKVREKYMELARRRQDEIGRIRNDYC